MGQNHAFSSCTQQFLCTNNLQLYKMSPLHSEVIDFPMYYKPQVGKFYVKCFLFGMYIMVRFIWDVHNGKCDCTCTTDEGLLMLIMQITVCSICDKRASLHIQARGYENAPSASID